MNQIFHNVNILENKEEYKRISNSSWEEKSQQLTGEMI